MSGMPRSGSDDGELPEVDLVRRAYRAESIEEPPRALDDAIRAAARRAVGARPVAVEVAPGRPSAPRRTTLWRGAFAIAATVVLTSSLFVVTLREKDRDDARTRVASSAGEAVRSAPMEKAAPPRVSGDAAAPGVAAPESAQSAGGSKESANPAVGRFEPVPPTTAASEMAKAAPDREVAPAVVAAARKPVSTARAQAGGVSQSAAIGQGRGRDEQLAAPETTFTARDPAASTPSGPVEAQSRQANGLQAEPRMEIASRQPSPADVPDQMAPPQSAPAEPFPAVAPAAPPAASIAATPPVPASATASIAPAPASSPAVAIAKAEKSEPVRALKLGPRVADSEVAADSNTAEKDRPADAVRDVAPSVRSAAKSASAGAARPMTPPAPRAADAPQAADGGGSEVRVLSESGSSKAAADKGASVVDASPQIPEPPLRWLERIRALRRDGQFEKARVEFERFKRAYPDYPLTDKDR